VVDGGSDRWWSKVVHIGGQQWRWLEMVVHISGGRPWLVVVDGDSYRSR